VLNALLNEMPAPIDEAAKAEKTKVQAAAKKTA